MSSVLTKNISNKKLALKITNPLVHKNWNEIISQLPEATIFFSSQWAQVLVRSYGYTPAFFLSRAGRDIDFFLPLMEVKSQLTGRRGIALPFTDFCAPFAIDINTFQKGFEEIIQLGKSNRWKYVEIRGGREFFAQAKPSLSYFHHFLKLDDEQRMHAKLSQSHRRNLKKAQKNGLSISFDQSFESMKDFYRLNCLTRKKHGLPPQPFYFFKNFHKFLLTENLATIVVAKKNEKPIAASVFLHFKDEVIYKYGASDSKYLNLRANHLVMWEAIKFFSEQGYRKLSFGKTEMANQGLRRFKSGFGAEEKIVNYYKFSFRKNDFITEKYQESGWHTALFRKMPLLVLKLLGKVLYRHVA